MEEARKEAAKKLQRLSRERVSGISIIFSFEEMPDKSLQKKKTEKFKKCLRSRAEKKQGTIY